MSDLDSIIAECDDILANQNTPFRPVVLLRLVQRLAREVERIESAHRAADSHPAQEESKQRSRARAKPTRHTSDAE